MERITMSIKTETMKVLRLESGALIIEVSDNGYIVKGAHGIAQYNKNELMEIYGLTPYQIIQINKFFDYHVLEYNISNTPRKYVVRTTAVLSGVGIEKISNGKDHKRGLYGYLVTAKAFRKLSGNYKTEFVG